MSKNSSKAIIGVLAATSLVAGAGVAVADTVEAAASNGVVATSGEHAATVTEGGLVSVANVEGRFAFSQDSITPNKDIASVFRTAAQAICASMPVYSDGGLAISVCGDVDNAYSATVEEMAEENGVDTRIMGCACSGNQAGGGAIVNAEVSGVSIADIMARAAK